MAAHPRKKLLLFANKETSEFVAVLVAEMDFLLELLGLPWQRRRQRLCQQCGRPMSDPWVRKILWRRECLPNPVYLPGEFHGQRSLVGYSPWGCRVGQE